MLLLTSQQSTSSFCRDRREGEEPSLPLPHALLGESIPQRERSPSRKNPLRRFPCSFAHTRRVCEAERRRECCCMFLCISASSANAQAAQASPQLSLSSSVGWRCVCRDHPLIAPQQPEQHQQPSCSLRWMFVRVRDRVTGVMMKKLLQNVRMTFYKACLSTSSGCRVCHT